MIKLCRLACDSIDLNCEISLATFTTKSGSIENSEPGKATCLLHLTSPLNSIYLLPPPLPLAGMLSFVPAPVLGKQTHHLPY